MNNGDTLEQNKTQATSSSTKDRNSNDMPTLEDDLREVFYKFSSNLNVVHINAQSIYAHHLALLNTFSTLYDIDAILISESFLKPTTSSSECDLPGYELIRNDRMESGLIQKGCGGTAIYLRKNLRYNIVDRSPNSTTMSAEHLFIEIVHEETKILLGVFYSPSLRIDYFLSFDLLLEKYRSVYDHVLIQGDFNTNLLRRNSRSKKLLSIIDSHKLNILPLMPTHYQPHSEPSILDLIIVSNSDKVAKFGQLKGYFSYHDIIYVSYDLQLSTNKHSMNILSKSEYSNNNGEGSSHEIVNPFWQSPRVRQALAEQYMAMKKYASDQSKSNLLDYQMRRDEVKKLDTEFKREMRKK